MDDVIVENSEQFWAGLGKILKLDENNRDSALILPILDDVINVYIKFVTDYLDIYLVNEKDFMNCCYKLIISPIYQVFSDKIVEHAVQLCLSKKVDVKELYVLYNILFLAGKENDKIFKQMANVREQKFVSDLIGHIKNDDILQQISIKLLFEICCVRRLSIDKLDLIDMKFLNHLLDLVEKTRDDQYESFNYSVIRLILSFNEQFMVVAAWSNEDDWRPNAVLQVLEARIGSSKTFGENVIFMLNRAVDHHIQMLILKLLYGIFTTPGTFEYFYTNDLHVLMDVFIRELYDLPEECEALRHTYLRVLDPLITNTQLRQHRYKQHQIYNLLLDLNGFSIKRFKPVSPTTQRLVDRCLMTEYLAGPRNCSDGIRRTPTPNALVMGMDTANSSNRNSICLSCD